MESLSWIWFLASSQAVFGHTGNENETASASTPTSSAFGAMANFLVPKLSVGLPGSLSHERSSNSDQSKLIRRERHAVRPPVEHNWSLSGSGADVKPPQIFQHELLQNFSINMFCKVWILAIWVLSWVVTLYNIAFFMRVSVFPLISINSLFWFRLVVFPRECSSFFLI